MGFLKKILPVAAAAGANFLLPGSGALAGGVASSLLGGGSNKNISQANQAFDRQAYANALRYNRPDQTNASGATSKWTYDPTTGQSSQVQSFGPEEQKRRDMFNQIAMSRMQNAGQMKLPDLSQGINYGAWRQPAYGSPGGDFGASALMGR